ncbi:hypothetical protein ScPMuIL_012396 [Solemya velum]
MSTKSKAKPDDATKKRKALEDNLLLNLVQRYFKLAGLVLLIWFVGYFSFSPSWLLLGLIVYIWKEKHTRDRQHQIHIAQQTARGEKDAVLARVDDLPSWVFFPDVERAEWVNKFISQLWPYVGDYVKDLLVKTVEPKVQQSLPASINSFRFVNIDLGDIPPRIGGVKVYSQNVRRDEIYMDLDIIYSSDSEVTVKIKGITAGIKDLQLHGILRVVFKPLISIIPLFGGISVFFLNNPTLDFNLTSLANAFDLPGLNDMLKTIIQEQIAAIMVLPNRIPIAMTKGIDLNKLRYPFPHGVLRIHVIEAKDLISADISLTGKGKSDPYAVIRVGAQKFKTKVLNNTISPVWDASYETIIDVKEGQFVEIDIMDEDPGSKDDALGSVNLDVSSVAEKGTIDSWLPLEDVKKGLVHVRLIWLHLNKDPLELDKIVKRMDDDNDNLSSCILMVNLDSAGELPRGKKQMVEPNPYATLSVGQVRYETYVKPNTDSPRWEQNFRFLVHNPHFQTIEVDVFDKKTGKQIGEVSLPLKNLLSAPDMILDRQFQLKKSGPTSYVNMRLALRVLTTELNPDYIDQEDVAIIDDTKPAETEGTENKPATGINEESPETNVDSPVTETITPSLNKETELRQRKPPSARFELQSSPCGRVQVTFRYSTQRQKLIVVIHKCMNLCAAKGDSAHMADPYIRLYLLPDRSSSSKRKTHVIKDNLNPVFDETFEFAVSPGELSTRSLEITVKNETGMFSSSQKVLGVLLIELDNLDISKAITEWFDLQPEDSEQKAVSLESEV